MAKNKENKVNKVKVKTDKSKIFIRIMALILAGLMVLSIAGTLIFYLTQN